MGVLKVMSVGKSGVGKSTIGNCFLHGNPMGESFATSASAESCTQESSWVSSKDIKYCDVPGIPDTVVANTKKFYDILIDEARKELNVILFVFKYERIDVAAYSKAKLLFRELKKSRAIKVLVINDMTNYAFGQPPTPENYKVIADSIKEGTDLSFSHVISMTGATMAASMNNLKQLLSQTKPYSSPTLKTFVQLQEYVNELRANQNYAQVIYDEGMAEIARLEQILTGLEATAAAAATAATAATVFSFFTFGATLGVATPAALAAAAAIASIEIKKQELQEVRNNMSKDRINEATRLLKEACDSFKELEDALTK